MAGVADAASACLELAARRTSEMDVISNFRPSSQMIRRGCIAPAVSIMSSTAT
jgi:hypothetical protein